MKKYTVEITFVIVIIIMLFATLFWNYVSKEQAEKRKKDEKAVETLDSVESSNVSIVDAKLGKDFRITQDYLIKYTRKKSSIWYLSSAKIKSIKENEDNLLLILYDNNDELIAYINKERADVHVDDFVYFVGTIDLRDGSVILAKISTEQINYSNSIGLSFNDLVTNILLLRATHFHVSGYLVKEENIYKLFDSRNSYNEDNSVGTYFTVEFNEEIDLNNQDVVVDCFVKDTYKLGECSLIEK